MIKPGFFRRHVQASGNDLELAHLDVAQEYILEYMRREELFDGYVVFKGGTALRKFVFGHDGRMSTDMDFGLLMDDLSMADYVLDVVDRMDFGGVRARLKRRKGANAEFELETSIGTVNQYAAISIRTQVPWLPTARIPPRPFEALDRGLDDSKDFTRAVIPIVDPREIAAEKLAAFWRRRAARDLYDLEHLGRVLQADFDGEAICTLGVLKIYFDVVDERLGRPLPGTSDVLACGINEVQGMEDLGHLRSSIIDIEDLLNRCKRRYRDLVSVDPEVGRLALECNPRDRRNAVSIRHSLLKRMSTSDR